jgi:hypothetical protein
MDIVLVALSIILVMSHLITCQMGHPFNSNKKWYIWSRWLVEQFDQVRETKTIPSQDCQWVSS